MKLDLFNHCLRPNGELRDVSVSWIIMLLLQEKSYICCFLHSKTLLQKCSWRKEKASTRDSEVWARERRQCSLSWLWRKDTWIVYMESLSLQFTSPKTTLSEKFLPFQNSRRNWAGACPSRKEKQRGSVRLKFVVLTLGNKAISTLHEIQPPHVGRCTFVFAVFLQCKFAGADSLFPLPKMKLFLQIKWKIKQQFNKAKISVATLLIFFTFLFSSWNDGHQVVTSLALSACQRDQQVPFQAR